MYKRLLSPLQVQSKHAAKHAILQAGNTEYYNKIGEMRNTKHGAKRADNGSDETRS